MSSLYRYSTVQYMCFFVQAQYSASVRYSTVMYGVLFVQVQHSKLQYRCLLCTVQYCTVQYSTAQHSTGVLFVQVQYSTVHVFFLYMHSTVQVSGTVKYRVSRGVPFPTGYLFF